MKAPDRVVEVFQFRLLEGPNQGFLSLKVFDFALDRALRQISDYSCRLNVNEDNPEKFTRKDIEQLKPGALDLIIKEALSFSELDDIEELDKQIGQFREEK